MTSKDEKEKDEFEATRQVVQTLEPFDNDERERILRWSRDKLGMGTPPEALVRRETKKSDDEHTTPPPPPAASDIRTFINTKNPLNDSQLAAVIAYFLRFVETEGRKETISKEDLVEACRRARRDQPKRPAQTLVNAYGAGYFDKAGRGQYKLNGVGENLVVMALPSTEGSSDVQPRRLRPSLRAAGARSRSPKGNRQGGRKNPEARGAGKRTRS